MTGGVEYTASQPWRGSARLEYRKAAGGDNLFGALGYARELGDGLTLLGRAFWNAGAAARSTAHPVSSRALFDMARGWDVGLSGSTTWAGGVAGRRFGAGAELGRVLVTNMRVATGYNPAGFADRDLAAAGYTARGAYVDVSVKFDEMLFGRRAAKREAAAAAGGARR